MAISQRKTCVAVLRGIIGIRGKEAEFAALVDRSRSWVKRVCAGEIPLTREAAIRISFETGVCPDWLVRNDVSQPPVTADGGRAYDEAAFQTHRAELTLKKPAMIDPLEQVRTIILPEFFLVMAEHFYASRGSQAQIDALTQQLKAVQVALAKAFPLPEVEDEKEVARANAEFCRLALRSGLARLKTRAPASSADVDGEDVTKSTGPAKVPYRMLDI